MKSRDRKLSSRIEKGLERLPLFVKIPFLFSTAFILFPFFVPEDNLRIYYCFLTSFVLVVVVTYRIIIGREAFVAVLSMWAIGIIIYLIITTILILFNVRLSPYYHLNTLLDRWLYALSWPIRMLGTLIVGLIFIRVTSPIEFIGRKGGYWLAVLLRMTQYASESFIETRTALRMQGEWPEQSSGIFNRIRAASLAVKSSPKLIATTIRNTLLWVPWASLCFGRIRGSLEPQKQPKEN